MNMENVYLDFRNDCSGEVNIVAMVLIIMVVIAVVAIFKTEMIDVVTQMFDRLREALEIQ